MKNGNKIKVGVYTSGAHLKLVAEYDLITQNAGNKSEAIYLQANSFLVDPRLEISPEQIKKYIALAKVNFENNSFDFKTSTREEADSFIAFNTKDWIEVQPMTER